MTEKNEQSSFVYTNIQTFFEIAKESLQSMNLLIQNNRKPKPNGEPGWIITLDPDHKSFKESILVIVFSGIYLEALLHQLIVKNNGLKKFKKLDKNSSHKTKLQALGCSDESILDECEHYKVVRKEILHEKAHLDRGAIRFAQKEATRAFNMVQSINSHFGINF